MISWRTAKHHNSCQRKRHDARLEFPHVLGVNCIVCGQHHGDYRLAHLLPFVGSEVLQDVALRLLHDLKTRGSVHVLQRRYIVVPQRKVVASCDKEGVGYTRVALAANTARGSVSAPTTRPTQRGR